MKRTEAVETIHDSTADEAGNTYIICLHKGDTTTHFTPSHAMNVCFYINLDHVTKTPPPLTPAMLNHLFCELEHNGCVCVCVCHRGPEPLAQRCVCVDACAHLAPRRHGAMKRRQPHVVFGVDPGP